jgi:hypothetical protein
MNMKSRINVLRFLAITICTGCCASAQLNVAANDALGGVARASGHLASGVIRTTGGLIMAIPVPIGAALASATVAGTAAFGTALVSGSARGALNTGTAMLKPSALAAKDISFGFAKAGWHLVFLWR